MRYFLFPIVLIAGLASGSAWATVSDYNLVPGVGGTITPTPVPNVIYTGQEAHSGPFTDSYYIDFTQYGNPDIWTIQTHAFGSDLNGQPFGSAGGLSSLSMTFTNTVTGATWTESNPAQIISSQSTPIGLLTVVDQGEDLILPALPLGTYRLDVTGAGTGTYSITMSVPEPETWAIYLAGLALIGLRLYRQNNRNA